MRAMGEEKNYYDEKELYAKIWTSCQHAKKMSQLCGDKRQFYP